MCWGHTCWAWRSTPISAHGDLPGLAWLCLLLLGIHTLNSLLTWLQSYVMAGAAQRTVRDIRNDLFGKLQALPLRFFDQRAHGDLMSRLTNDVENVNQVLADGVVQVVSGVLSMIGVAAVMLWINPLAGADQPAVDQPDDADAQPLDRPAHARRLPQPAGSAGHAERPDRRDDHRPARGQGLPSRAGGDRAVRCLQPRIAPGRHARADLRRLHRPDDELCEQPGPGDRGRLRRLDGRAGHGHRRHDRQLHHLLAPVRPAAERAGHAVRRDPVGDRRGRAGVRGDRRAARGGCARRAAAGPDSRRGGVRRCQLRLRRRMCRC